MQRKKSFISWRNTFHKQEKNKKIVWKTNCCPFLTSNKEITPSLQLLKSNWLIDEYRRYVALREWAKLLYPWCFIEPRRNEPLLFIYLIVRLTELPLKIYQNICIFRYSLSLKMSFIYTVCLQRQHLRIFIRKIKFVELA